MPQTCTAPAVPAVLQERAAVPRSCFLSKTHKAALTLLCAEMHVCASVWPQAASAFPRQSLGERARAPGAEPVPALRFSVSDSTCAFCFSGCSPTAARALLHFTGEGVRGGRENEL